MDATRRSSAGGFTVLELMITVGLLAILVVAVEPSLLTTSRNSQIRAVAESWRDGLVQARIEAIRRNTRVTFCPGVPSNAADWTLILTASDSSCQTTAPIAQYNAGAQIAGNVQIAVPRDAGATYDGTGRMVPLNGHFVVRITSQTANCIASGGAVRCLSVEATGGSVRTCDPSAATSAPQSCAFGG